MTSIKGHNSVINLRKIMSNNPNQDLVNINAYIYKVKLCIFILKIWSGNSDISQGQNSITNARKMMCNNPNLHVDLVDTNAYYKFSKIYQFILKL